MLERDFFKRDTNTVAKEILGKVLVRNINGTEIRARIVEVESYLGYFDKASHSYGGRRTKRTETMYMEGGVCYVYFTYGMYNLLNIVTEEKDKACAVLIRAVEPLDHLDIISQNRYNMNYEELNSYKRKNITNGPGKLTMALNIDRSLDKEILVKEKIYIEDDGFSDFKIVEAKRVGIDYAEEWKDKLLRFYIENNKYVSVQ